MNRHRGALALLIGLFAAGVNDAPAQQIAGAGRTGAVPAPVTLDHEGRFIDRWSRVGSDVFIAGQPTEAALRALRDSGVTVVVNLRTPSEMTNSVSYDEERVAKSLGMTYVFLPVRGDGAFPYAPETVSRFVRALESANGKVLLHCTVAWRASHLWAAYLIERRGMPVEAALEHARKINLMDDMRHGPGRQPVEDFLNRDLAALKRPPGLW